nr:hypothetical protein [Tanacetum cinerariifolium]
ELTCRVLRLLVLLLELNRFGIPLDEQEEGRGLTLITSDDQSFTVNGSGDKSPEKGIPGDKSSGKPPECRWGKPLML